MNWLNGLNLDTYMLQVLLLDLALSIPLLTLLGLTASWLHSVKLTEELAIRDNPALGLALAGSVISLFLVLSATMQGEAALTLWHEAGLVLAYGSASLLLVRLGLFLQDWLILRDIDLRHQISQRNLSAAMVEAASAIAIGLLLTTALSRTDSHSLNGLLALLIAFVLSQCLLSLMTCLYQWRYRDQPLQTALKAGNLAVAIQFSGRLLAGSLIVNTASNLVGTSDQLLQDWLLWFSAALIVMLVQAVLAAITRRILLARIDRKLEIQQQANIAVACLDLAISIGISLLVNSLS